MTNKDIDMIQENICRDSFKNEYWKMYQDVWNFHKKYSNVQTDDAYWEVVVDESGQIVKKYDKHKLVIALLLVVIGELERIYMEQGLEEFKQTTIDYFQYVKDTNANPDIEKRVLSEIIHNPC